MKALLDLLGGLLLLIGLPLFFGLWTCICWAVGLSIATVLVCDAVDSWQSGRASTAAKRT